MDNSSYLQAFKYRSTGTWEHNQIHIVISQCFAKFKTVVLFNVIKEKLRIGYFLQVHEAAKQTQTSLFLKVFFLFGFNFN